MAFQFAFAGDGVQDGGAFLASFEHHAVSIGKVNDIEKLPLLVATFYSRAREWYESLPPNQQTNYQLLVQQFRSKYIRRRSAMEVREELFALRMTTSMEYSEYERVFKELWSTWIRLRGGVEDEWFKMDRFKAGLNPYFAMEANLKDPTNFQTLLQVCQIYDRQLKVMRMGVDTTVAIANANVVSTLNAPHPSSIVHGGQVFPNIFNSNVANQASLPMLRDVDHPRIDGSFPEQLNRRLDELTNQFRQMQASFNTNQVREVPPEKRVPVCYSCGVEGHIATRCPSRRQGGLGRGIYQLQGGSNAPNNHANSNNQVSSDGGPLPMAQVPTIPSNVNLLDFMYDTDDDCDVVPIKRTRATHKGKEVEGESSNPQIKKKTKESKMENPSKRRRSRRKINMEDMPMGKGVEPFDLKQELITNGPRITWPQLLQLSPKIRKEWGRLASIRQSTKTVHYAGVVRVKERKDIRPTIPVSIKGYIVKDALVDSGARISLISEVLISKLDIPICKSSSAKVAVADGGLVPCMGIIEDVILECFGICISMDFHVIPLKGPSYSLVLGRPWMQELNVIQDWSNGLMTLAPSESVNIVYDMRLQQVIKGARENNSFDSEYEEESSASDSTSSDWEETTSYVISKEEKEDNKEEETITLEQREKMISKDIQGEDRQRFVSLLSEFPRLFINDYSQIRGVDVIKHQIKLKEGSEPVAQKLRRLGTVQKEALLKEVKALLRAGFIYPVEDSEWVSPVVVVPKKNGKWRVCVDFKPLNAATKRDHFPLPFQDEILDEIAGHEMYTVCDGYSGYFQIRIAEEDQRKTTFITPWGCFAYKCMPFGLTNAVFTFNRLAIHVFQPFFGKFVRVFIDDFAIYSTRIGHLEKVRAAFKRLDECKGQLNPEKCHVGEKEVAMLGHVVSLQGIKVDPSKIKVIESLPYPKDIKSLEVFVQKVRYFERFIHMLAQALYPFRVILRTNIFVWNPFMQEKFDRVRELLAKTPILKPPDRNSTFFLSLSVSSHAIGSILMQQDPHNKLMHPIYYISRAISDVEKTFMDVEKWVLALTYACQKFRSFLIPQHFVIITSMSLLPYVLQHVNVSSRITKWALLLVEFDFEVRLESTMRAELADLLTYRESLHEEDLSKLRDALPEPDIEDAFTLFFDGAYRKATNLAVGGFILRNPNGEVVHAEGISLPNVNTNNEAEYATLCFALRLCKARAIKRLIIKGDSLLIVKQIQGMWKCQSDGLRGFYKEALSLMKSFSKVQVKHVSRVDNKEADALAQEQLVKIKGEPVCILEECKGAESLLEIQELLNDGVFPKDLNGLQRRRLVSRSSQYVVVGKDLYHKGKDDILRRVPLKEEIVEILRKMHEEACGGHFSHDIMLRKIMLTGFTWPTIHKDIHEWCKSCDACQKAGRRHLRVGPLHPIVVFAPFEKWGIDAVGPLPKTQHGKEYILVAIDYMTKWAEVAATSSIKSKDVAQFIYRNICTRFGVPLEIVSDHGPSFRGEVLAYLLEKLKIKHRYSTPYYPQANGAVEKVNGILVKNLQKLVNDKMRTWDKFLDDAIWAYRVSFKLSTGFTPFFLVYGQEALFPIELQVRSNRLMQASCRDGESAMEDRLAHNHVLQYSREEAVEHYLQQAWRRKQYYDKKARLETFLKGSLVLRYDNRFDNIKGQKMVNRWEGPFVVHEVYDNGSYQLKDIDGTIHELRVNGWRLKQYLNRGPTYLHNVNEELDDDATDQNVDLFPCFFFN